MSGTPGLGAFNKDKVANKFGIQLKPKGAAQRPVASLTQKTTTPTGTSNITKNKTISDFRTDNNTNGFSSNINHPTSSKTPEPTKKLTEKPLTSKSSSGLVNTSVKDERTNSLTSKVNHSTTQGKQPSPAKSPTTTKRPSVTPASPTARPSVSTTNSKTEAQIEHQKDQPLYRRQLSKQLENTSPTANKNPPTTTTTASTTTSLKR